MSEWLVCVEWLCGKYTSWTCVIASINWLCGRFNAWMCYDASVPWLYGRYARMNMRRRQCSVALLKEYPMNMLRCQCSVALWKVCPHEHARASLLLSSVAVEGTAARQCEGATSHLTVTERNLVFLAMTIIYSPALATWSFTSDNFVQYWWTRTCGAGSFLELVQSI
jgi:hypothetical protein